MHRYTPQDIPEVTLLSISLKLHADIFLFFFSCERTFTPGGGSPDTNQRHRGFSLNGGATPTICKVGALRVGERYQPTTKRTFTTTPVDHGRQAPCHGR